MALTDTIKSAVGKKGKEAAKDAAGGPEAKKKPRRRFFRRRGEDEEGKEEETDEKPKKSVEEEVGSLISPEALVFFFAAIMLDLFGLIIFILDFVFGVGLIVSAIPDIIGLIFIGSWMYFRTGHITITRRGQKTIKKTGRKLFKRLGLSFLGEIIPVFGDVAFCWTLAVYFELKNN